MMLINHELLALLRCCEENFDENPDIVGYAASTTSQGLQEQYPVIETIKSEYEGMDDELSKSEKGLDDLLEAYDANQWAYRLLSELRGKPCQAELTPDGLALLTFDGEEIAVFYTD